MICGAHVNGNEGEKTGKCHEKALFSHENASKWSLSLHISYSIQGDGVVSKQHPFPVDFHLQEFETSLGKLAF